MPRNANESKDKLRKNNKQQGTHDFLYGRKLADKPTYTLNPNFLNPKPRARGLVGSWVIHFVHSVRGFGSWH